ncbi:monovalent cation:proton antiporter-2 (CPA2) family protein [Reinekea sp.]|jgi:CPA2 family monovalent cation:H+ antiporter-2|uniref:monovalent cation:proton antiporter-2 (CPA2) family protein n=1 Tax=Reinekea sp. TaxID=1970455 RepID=UPI002A7F4863|nr:monovalent cation:proton antiporter-2 (CPA2) family protein [Reinekea sp.]
MTDVLLLTFVFLVAGVVAVPIATRLGLGSVLGYLIAGIALSPLLAWLHVDLISIQHFAEFGVVMMLFLVGLELEPKMLWQMRHKLLGLGGFQVGSTVLAVMLIAMLLGQPWTIALAIGMVLALSSTAIVLQTLNEKNLVKSDGGQASFSVLLFQDIAVIPMLALIPLLALPELLSVSEHAQDLTAADHGTSLSLVAGLSGWQTTLVTIGAIAFVLFVGSYLTRPLFRFIASAQLRELFTATALLMVIGIALLMTLVGLSPALGTFLAGVVLANSEYRHELESDIAPFKGLLLGLFFITIGASINFDLLFSNFSTIMALTLGLIALKAGVLLVLSLIFKVRGADRWLMALGLAQAGEFGFVLLSFTVASSVIPVEIADRLMLVVALSMMLTPLLFILYDRVIEPRFANAQEREMDEITEQQDIIIIGHGRIGGIVNRMMRAAGYKTTVIDYSSTQLEMLRTIGLRVFFGDGTRPDLLHSAGIDKAKLLVVAIDGKEQITELVHHVIKEYPNLHVLARATDRNHVYDLWAVGCRDIVRETYDSSLRMGRSAFQALGIESERAALMTEQFNQRERQGMIDTAELYRKDVPLSQNTALQAKIKELLAAAENELLGQHASVEADDETAIRSQIPKA